jgi:hypothetical protein
LGSVDVRHEEAREWLGFWRFGLGSPELFEVPSGYCSNTSLRKGLEVRSNR